MFVALDHDDQRVVRQGEVHEVVALGEQFLGDLDFRYGGFDFFRQFHAEVVVFHRFFFRHVQQVRHFAHRGALGEERNDGDEEYDVEDEVGVMDLRDEGVGGEDDGHGAPQAHPGNIQFRLAAHFPEGGEADEYAGGASEEHHEYADEQSQYCDGNQFVGVYEESQGEEHDNLEQPREAVEEGDDALFVLDLAVADDEPGDVHREVTVSFHQLRGGKDEEYESEEQDGVEGVVVHVQPVHHPHRQASQKEARDGTHAHLDDEHEEGLPPAEVAGWHLYDLYQQQGQHVGHGVVAPALEFEHGAEFFFQSLFFAAEDGEDRRGVGGGHDGSHEEGFGDADGGVVGEETAYPVDEQPGEGGGQHHAEGGEEDALSQYGFDFGKLGVHTARKEDDAQGNHADELRAGGVVELDARAVAPAYHAHAEEEEQDGHSEAEARLAGDDTEE